LSPNYWPKIQSLTLLISAAARYHWQKKDEKSEKTKKSKNFTNPDFSKNEKRERVPKNSFPFECDGEFTLSFNYFCRRNRRDRGKAPAAKPIPNTSMVDGSGTTGVSASLGGSLGSTHQLPGGKYRSSPGLM